MKLLIFFLLFAGSVFAQFGSNARTLSRKPLCSATVTTNCVPSLDGSGAQTGGGSDATKANLAGGNTFTGTQTIGTTVATKTTIDPAAGLTAPIVACVGSPGNTTGPYRSLCVTTAGAAYACGNASGCTVAGDWVSGGASGPTQYYVDPASGSDSNAGTSITSPWLSLAKGDQQTLTAGQQVILVYGGQQYVYRTSASPALVTTGLLADYDFLQGAVATTVYDRSGNGNNGAFASVAAVLPTWVQNGVQFPPGIPYATFPNSVWQAAKTLSAVGTYRVGSGYRAVWGAGGAAFTVLLHNGNIELWNYGGAGRVTGSSGVSRSYDTAHVALTNFTVVSSTTTDKIYMDGVQAPYAAQGATGATTRSTGGFIGTAQSGGGLFDLGGYDTFSSMQFYSTELSAAQVVQNQAVIANRMRFRIPGAQVIFDGDSITSGNNNSAGNAWPLQLARLLPEMTYRVIATSGQNLAGEITTFYQTAGAILNPYATQVVLQFEGTNDLAAATGAVATLETNIQTYCGQIRWAGGVCLVGTLLPRNNGFAGGQDAAGFETDRTTYNTWLRANYTSFASGIVDFGNDPIMGQSATLTNTVYYLDQLHPTDEGARHLANIALPVIRRVTALR